MQVINEDSIWEYASSGVKVFVDVVKDDVVYLQPLGKVLDPWDRSTYPIAAPRENFLEFYRLVRDIRAELLVKNNLIEKSKLMNTTPDFDKEMNTPYTFPRIGKHLGTRKFAIQNLEFQEPYDFNSNMINIRTLVDAEIRKQLTDEDIFEARRFLESKGFIVIKDSDIRASIRLCLKDSIHESHNWYSAIKEEDGQIVWSYTCPGVNI